MDLKGPTTTCDVLILLLVNCVETVSRGLTRSQWSAGAAKHTVAKAATSRPHIARRRKDPGKAYARALNPRGPRVLEPKLRESPSLEI